MATEAERIQRMFGGMLKGVGQAGQEGGGRLKGFLKSGGAKAGIGSLVAWMALSRILEERNKAAMRGVQTEAIRGQAEMASPESLYYQAALPSAEREEEQARAAMFAQIGGGVLGPQLARGEKYIGGR